MKTNEELLEEFVEHQRQELRKEGADELRASIVAELEHRIRGSWTQQEKVTLMTAKLIVEAANI